MHFLIIVILSVLSFVSCGGSTGLNSISTNGIDSVLIGPVDTPIGKALPVDVQSIDVAFELDAQASKVDALAKLQVIPSSAEYKPLLALPPSATNITIKIDGLAFDSAKLYPVTILGHAFHAFDVTLTQATHDFEITYTFTSKTSLLTNYSDLSGNGLQDYVPTNPMLYDRFSFTGSMKVINTANTYDFFANTTITNSGTNEWSFSYPSRINALAPFFHVLAQNTIIDRATGTFNSLNGPVTVQVYRTSGSAAAPATALTVALDHLAQIETLLGTYAHGDKFVVYLVPGSGGMEYAGATITSLGALRHEVFHSWYATGVFPRYYSDGWIDEALARWFDNSNPVASLPFTTPIKLSGYSPYDLQFPIESYSYGSKLMAHLAHLAGGKNQFMTILAAFFAANKLKTVTTEDFRTFVENWLGQDLKTFFMAYVYKSTGRIDGEPVDPLGGQSREKPPLKEGLESGF